MPLISAFLQAFASWRQCHGSRWNNMRRKRSCSQTFWTPFVALFTSRKFQVSKTKSTSELCHEIACNQKRTEISCETLPKCKCIFFNPDLIVFTKVENAFPIWSDSRTEVNWWETSLHKTLSWEKLRNLSYALSFLIK